MTKKILFLLIILFLFLFVYWQKLNFPVSQTGEEIIFTVAKGESIKQISQNLKQAKLIKSQLFFRYLIWRESASIKAGKYLISPKLTTKEIINLLVKGEVINQETVIRIIEGWKMAEIDQYFKKNNLISNVNFLKLANAQLKNWPFSFEQPKFLNNAPATANLEGFLFPDTYKIYLETNAEEVIKKLLENFDDKLTLVMRQEITKQNKNIFEIVTMASVIEKEARTVNDMKIVAGIFWDRIKNRIPLQSDATLSYIFNDKKPVHTIEETKVISLYNTYLNSGPPPGPICNPGLNAITAAIYPILTDYNYFLHKLDSGETVFSKTLDEHNRNRAKYLK